MTTRLPHEDDPFPIYIDARGVAIQIGDTVAYGTRKNNQAEIVEAAVVGFSDSGQVIVDVIRRSLSDRTIWLGDNWRGSRIDPDRVMVVTFPPSTRPTRQELITAKKRQVQDQNG